MLLHRRLRARVRDARATLRPLFFNDCYETCGNSSISSRPVGRAECYRDVVASGAGPRGKEPSSCPAVEGTWCICELEADGVTHSWLTMVRPVGDLLTAWRGRVAAAYLHHRHGPRWTIEAVCSVARRVFQRRARAGDADQEQEGGGGGSTGDEDNGGQESHEEEDEYCTRSRRFGFTARLNFCTNVDALAGAVGICGANGGDKGAMHGHLNLHPGCDGGDVWRGQVHEDRGDCRRSRFPATINVGARNASSPMNGGREVPYEAAGMCIEIGGSNKVQGYAHHCDRRVTGGREGRGE